MSHLTNEEILRFVSFETLSDENLKLAAKVNSHILKCDTCLDLVREQQERYDNGLRENGGQELLKRSSEEDDGEMTLSI